MRRDRCACSPVQSLIDASSARRRAKTAIPKADSAVTAIVPSPSCSPRLRTLASRLSPIRVFCQGHRSPVQSLIDASSARRRAKTAIPKADSAVTAFVPGPSCSPRLRTLASRPSPKRVFWEGHVLKYHRFLGTTTGRLACVSHPDLRSEGHFQHASACPSSADKQSRNASDWTRPRGWHCMLKTPLSVRAEWLLMAPPTGICAFVVGNFTLDGFPVP